MKVLCTLVAAMLFGLTAAPLAAQAPGSNALEGVGIDQRLDGQVPADLEFRDETGRTVHLGDYFGRKPIVLALVYFRCPMLCTLVLNGLLEGLRGMPDMNIGEQFEVLTVSFDPKDTPEAAAKKKQSFVESYARPGVAEGWHFLTGQQPAIDRLTAAVGYRYKYDEKLDQYIHPAAIMILTPDGRITRYFYGIKYASRDVRLGLVEASQGKIGTPTDQILLYCFHYDPTVGKYTANILRIMQFVGVVTIGLLGVFFLALRRRQRRKAAVPAG